MATASRSPLWLLPALLITLAGCPGSDQPPVLGPADPDDAVLGPEPTPPVAVGQVPQPTITSVPGARPTPSDAPNTAPPGEEEEEEGQTPQPDLVVVQAPADFRGKATVTVEIHFPEDAQAAASTNDVKAVEVVLNQDRLFGVKTVARGTIERSKMVAYRAAVQFTDVIGDDYKVEVIAKGLGDERLGSKTTEVDIDEDAIARLYALMSVPPAGEVNVDLKVEPAVYVQGGTPTGMTVMWESGQAIASRVVLKDAQGVQVAVLDGASARRHQHAFTGLKPGTTYQYEAFEGELSVGSGSFRTNRAVSDSKFKFAVFGDSGRRTSRQFAVARQLEVWKPEFMLHTGDVVYPHGEAKDYGPKYVEPYRNLIRSTVMYPSLGNHDYRSSRGQPYLDFFEVPKAASDTERYYAFAYGNALFLGLDTNQDVQPGSVQHTWLEGQLKASTADWIFPFFHHPPYSAGDHKSNTTARKGLSPLFEKYNVQLVFAGHDHNYERTKALEDFVKDGRPVTYMVAGGGGADLRDVDPQAFTALAVQRHHFVGVTIDGKKLTMEAVDHRGEVFDRLSLTAP